jgi:aminocarboxymuconate-semialdehyde decarboxylase
MVNDAYAELISKYPRRFMGFASIPMDAPDEALKELDRALGELRMQGVVLMSNVQGRALTSPRYRPFFEEANRRSGDLHPPHASREHRELPGVRARSARRLSCDTTSRWPSSATPGFSASSRTSSGSWATPAAQSWLMERLDNGFRDFAECRVNIDELPSVYLKKLYYDTVTFSPYTLNLLRDLVGTDHMVMGSDYPHLLGSIDRAVSSIEGLHIPAAEKTRIFSGTALSILGNVERP